MSFDQLVLILIALFFILKFAFIGAMIWLGLRFIARLFSGPRDNSVKININITQPPPQLTPQQESRYSGFDPLPNSCFAPRRQVIDPTRPELELARREPPPLIQSIPSYAQIDPPTIDHVTEHPRRLAR